MNRLERARRQTVQPDGRCHAAITTVLVHGCNRPVPDGKWSCDAHAVELWRLGQELRSERKRGGG